MSATAAKKDAKKEEPVAEPADRLLNFAENLVYAAAGILLLFGAVVVMVMVCYHLALDIDEGARHAVAEALDGLLLAFILLELLAGIRATMTEKKLVAEPFLIVGIIASIKEIVLLTLTSQETIGESGEAFNDAMTEVSVLGGLVLILSLASYFVRRKEREPEEEENA
ncbi:MAG TPA: phosphate-starvation-inducible PsiE family protein [Acidimicrobiales bacterium]|nr:phosphate-starvation-inducible PsiE family protein [Acidimicrobiales bacterium]